MSRFEDCKFFLRDSCIHGPNCSFRHNELACLTLEVCRRWASGYVCDGRCNLRHPSVAELAAMEADQFYDKRQYEEQPQPRNSTPPKENANITPASVAAMTRLCKFFVEGRCTKGSTCPFTHAAEAMGENGPRPSVVRQKSPPPRDRQRNMTIAEGARPREADRSASQLSTSSPSSTTASAPVCKFFTKGRCTKGSSCLFLHESPHRKEKPGWDGSATAMVAPPKPERKVAALTLRAAAAKARAAASSTNAEDDAEQATADTSETSAGASSDERIGLEKGDGASSETGTMKTDMKAKALEILERHRLSKRLCVEAGRPKTSDAPPKRQRSLRGSVAASSAGRGAAGVSPESVDLPGKTKRQRSPERGPPGDEAAEILTVTKRQRS